MKQLTEDPWLSEVEQFKKGSKVEGTVTRITPFGAFVKISPAIEALVHVSELGKGNDVNPENIFTLNERKEFATRAFGVSSSYDTAIHHWFSKK